MIEQAIRKLNKEYADCKKLSKCGGVVAESVKNTLIEFCRQNEEFAQAVVQNDKPLKECIESTVKGANGKGISDIEVYRRAAAFYFEGAEIHFAMTIDLGDGGFSNGDPKAAPAPEKKGLKISLDDLL